MGFLYCPVIFIDFEEGNVQIPSKPQKTIYLCKMKTAEIVTTHNVIIQYDIASVMLRIVAQILDLLVIFIYIWLITLLFSRALFSGSTDVAMFIMWLFMLPVIFYSFLTEALFAGQTPGKMMLGLRVLNLNGENASLSELFMRWMFRMVDIIFSVGMLGVIVALSNEKTQRLGDVLANTIVIKIKPTTPLSITDILKIKKSEDYQPSYPEIVRFTDEDMLLVKNTLERLKNNPNEHYKRLAKELITKICSELNLPEPTTNRLEFLKTTLQDYIVLTRS
jgi:uncharacterized RDD family membrane protein YckC